MRFWDSSGVLPLFIAERSSRLVREWYNADSEVTVWALTRLEMLSAFSRRIRMQPEKLADFNRERATALRACQEWTEVTALETVRAHAERLVQLHPLKAADAMQLGAAIVAADAEPLDFVTLDARLADAARKEGFRVLGA